MDPLDDGGDTLRHLRRSDVVGFALVVAVAWISTITSHPRFYMVHNGRSAGVSAREWTARATAIAAATAIRFYALGQTPLLVAVATYTAAFAVITAICSAKEHPADFPRTLWWSIAVVLGLFTVLSASTTDQHATAVIVRDRVTQRSILEHLLVCALATVCVLTWINESHYAFGSSRSWTRHLRHVLVNSFFLGDEKASAARARAFAALSGLMAACAVHTEKCLAEILGIWDHGFADLASQSTLALLVLLATVWLVTTALECYWWHHAIRVDPSQAIPLLRPYLLTRMVLGVVKGVFFFDDIQPHRTLVAAAGLTAIFIGLITLKFRARIEPTREDDGATPILLDATESLLDIPASPVPHRSDSDSATPPYRPPVQFRFA